MRSEDALVVRTRLCGAYNARLLCKVERAEGLDVFAVRQVGRVGVQAWSPRPEYQRIPCTAARCGHVQRQTWERSWSPWPGRVTVGMAGGERARVSCDGSDLNTQIGLGGVSSVFARRPVALEIASRHGAQAYPKTWPRSGRARQRCHCAAASHPWRTRGANRVVRARARFVAILLGIVLARSGQVKILGAMTRCCREALGASTTASRRTARPLCQMHRVRAVVANVARCHSSARRAMCGCGDAGSAWSMWMVRGHGCQKRSSVCGQMRG